MDEGELRRGMELHRGGDLREAAEVYERILAEEPGNARVWAMLGQIWSTRMMFERSVACFGRAVEADGEQSLYPYFLATPLRRLGRLEESAQALSRAIGLRADHWESHIELIWTLERLGRDGEASEAREAFHAALPGSAGELERLGDGLRERRGRAAMVCYERANGLDSGDAVRWVKQADLERELGRLDASFESYQQAIGLDPEVNGAHGGLVAVCERLGRGEDARWYAAGALAQDPDNIDLRLAIAKLDRRDGDLVSAVGRLRGLKSDPRMDSKRTYGHVCVELGLALDAVGDADGAIRSIAEGKGVLAQRRAARRYPAGGIRAWIAQVRERTGAIEAGTWASGSGESGRGEPIFVVGFPGSGAGAIAGLLSRVAGIRSGGGGAMLPGMVREAQDLGGKGGRYPDFLGGLSGEDLAALRANYFAAADEDGDDEESWILDGMEMNITRLAAIARVFPGAKVLVAIRDPRDCCLESFFSLDEPDPVTANFFDFDSTTLLYEETMGLYLASRDRFGLDLIEVRAEEFGLDEAGVSRRILEFVGGVWSEGILGEAGGGENSGHGPADVGLVGGSRWRRYATYIEPVTERLAPFVEAFGYPAV